MSMVIDSYTSPSEEGEVGERNEPGGGDVRPENARNNG